MQRLYNLGARKFVLMSVNPNGCAPMARTAASPGHEGCIQSVNLAVRLFNSNLKTMVDDIKLEMPGSKLVFVNSYKIIRDIIKDPASNGKFHASLITLFCPTVLLHCTVITVQIFCLIFYGI